MNAHRNLYHHRWTSIMRICSIRSIFRLSIVRSLLWYNIWMCLWNNSWWSTASWSSKSSKSVFHWTTIVVSDHSFVLVPRHYAFPGHQPEFDFPQMKASVNTYVTEYRAGYCHQCQRPLPSDDPSWNSKTKVCLHCKDRIYTVDPNPDPYTLTVQYPQDPHRKNYTPAHQEIPTETSNNK